MIDLIIVFCAGLICGIAITCLILWLWAVVWAIEGIKEGD